MTNEQLKEILNDIFESAKTIERFSHHLHFVTGFGALQLWEEAQHIKKQIHLIYGIYDKPDD